MSRKLVLLSFLVSLIALAMADVLPQGSQTEAQFLQHGQKLTQQYDYAAALKILNLGLTQYPKSAVLIAEFKKDSELYILHEISQGYQSIDKNIHDVSAYIRVSNAWFLANETFKAFEVLLDGTAENQTSASLWVAIGNLEELSGRPAEAHAAFEEAKRYESVN